MKGLVLISHLVTLAHWHNKKNLAQWMITDFYSSTDSSLQQIYLVNHERKITVALNPLREHVVYNGLTCWSYLQSPQE